MVLLSFTSSNGGSSGTPQLSSFLLYLLLSFLLLLLSTSLGFIGGSVTPPSPLLFEVARSYITAFPRRMSSLFLPVPLFSPFHHYPHRVINWRSVLGGLGGWGNSLLTLFPFCTLTLFLHAQCTNLPPTLAATSGSASRQSLFWSF